MSSVGITVTLCRSSADDIASQLLVPRYVASLFLPHVPGRDTLRLIFTIINSFLLYLFALLARQASPQLTRYVG